MIWALKIQAMIFLLFASVVAQSESSRCCKAKLDPAKPSVYVSFSDQALPNNSDQESSWLELHNNSSFTIWIQASGDGADRNSIRAYYDVIQRKTLAVERKVCTVCSLANVLPGKTIRFRVPQLTLKDAAEIRLRFWFDFETEDDPFPSPGEPLHYARLEL
ncbi:MAG: hypothetical protein J5I65_02510 [Aridibacter famidurans]|nr:hypothetical protein [Aridibacter famidurans]